MNTKRSLGVLIADDEAMVNHALQSQATRLGHRVLGAAYNAEETVALARELRPDVIILDMKMPDPVSGAEDPEAGLKAALAVRQTCPTAIVLLTAYESPELVEKVREAGIGAYLLKPSKDNEVDRAIAIATARFQDLQELRRSNRTLTVAMEELQQRESLFRVISESAPMIIFRATPEGDLTYLSPRWVDFSEYDIPHGIEQGLQALAHPDDAPAMLASYRKAMEARTNWLHTHRLLTRMGSLKWVRVLAAPMYEPDGSFAGAVGVVDDVTQQKRAGELRQLTDKLESLGILAGGIAHDFNNILTAIQGNLELLRLHVAQGGSPSRYLENAQESVTRAAELARLMLSFSGRAPFATEPLDLNQIVLGLRHDLRMEGADRPRVRFEVEPGLPCIEGDRRHVVQVLEALLANALEASDNLADPITLSVSRRTLSREDVEHLYSGKDLEPGEYVAVQIQDTGCGMDPALLARIFDPFFTTKFLGRGLGLAATLGILQAHRAGLQVLSTPGEGSTFTIFFPPSRRLAREVAHPPRVEEAGPAGARTILLVDDEEALRDTVGEQLVMLGYHVIYAVDGQDCVDKFSAHAREIDLVILDLTMPRMDGFEAFSAIRTIDPGVKVVLSSGYNQQDATSRFQDATLAAFLHKPYKMKELESLLTRIIA